jgi:hypothetical protein
MFRPRQTPTCGERSAQPAHGTRPRFLGGCRCVACRAANARFRQRRRLVWRAGGGDKLVSERSREHLRRLSSAGVGSIAVAQASTLGESTVKDIRTGKRPLVRESTETLILSVETNAARKGALVDTSGAWAQIDELLAAGFNRADLALRLGIRTPKLQFRRSRMIQANVDRVDAFYRMIMAEGAEASSRY